MQTSAVATAGIGIATGTDKTQKFVITVRSVSSDGGSGSSGGSNGSSGGSGGFRSANALSAADSPILETSGAWEQDQRGW